MNNHMYSSNYGLMQPIALMGQNVALHYLDQIYYKRIRFLEAIPPFQGVDVGAIAAQTVSARTQVTNLEVSDDEFAQFRWYPLDNVQVRLWLPQAQGKYTLRNLQIAVDPTVVTRDPCLHLTEFFVWEQNEPFVECINYADYAVTMSRIVFMGFRFVVEDVEAEQKKAIKDGREPATHVWCSGKQF